MDGVGRVAAAIADGFEKSFFREGCPIAGVALDTVPESEMISAAVREAFLGWQDVIVSNARRLGDPEFTTDDALALVMMLEGAWIMARVQADAVPIRKVPEMFRRQYRRKG
jgi:TetR/AcrR family transcriptional regulator, lmrAB and yxaGH operons repressor